MTLENMLNKHLIYILILCFGIINTTHGQKTEIVSGSGFFINSSGYLATNYHVIEEAVEINVDHVINNETFSFKGEVVAVDIENDLAIIRPVDTTFNLKFSLPYTFKMMDIKVGEKCFSMGYPDYQTLGSEVKVTDGIINSKTGFQNDNRLYQISAPIQPGNSGGPLFDNNGNVIGITSSGIPSMDNVGYAIKISSLINLVDGTPSISGLPVQNTLLGKDLPGKVKELSKFITLLKVTIPACDEKIMNADFLKIKSDMSAEKITEITGVNGDNYRVEPNIKYYKWEYCGDVNKRIEVWYLNNKPLVKWKTFSDNSCGETISEESYKKLEINQKKELVDQLLGYSGDTFKVEYNTQIEYVKYYVCKSTNKWIEVWYRDGSSFHFIKNNF